MGQLLSSTPKVLQKWVDHCLTEALEKYLVTILIRNLAVHSTMLMIPQAYHYKRDIFNLQSASWTRDKPFQRVQLQELKVKAVSLAVLSLVLESEICKVCRTQEITRFFHRQVGFAVRGSWTKYSHRWRTTFLTWVEWGDLCRTRAHYSLTRRKIFITHSSWTQESLGSSSTRWMESAA